MNIEQRFAHLERSNRRLRTGLLSLTIAITTVLIVGQAKPEKVPDVIQAKEFQVVNDKGKKLVRMGATEDGKEGMVSTFNGKGQKLVVLGGMKNGEGMVSTYNGKGQVLVELGVTTNGEGMVTTFNDKGQELVDLGVLKDGGGTVTTYIGDGRITGGIGDK
jgi:hypothetical protein